MTETTKIQRFGVFDPNIFKLPKIEDNTDDRVTEAFFYAIKEGDFQVLDIFPHKTHFKIGDFLVYVKSANKKAWFKCEPAILKIFLDGKPVFEHGGLLVEPFDRFLCFPYDDAGVELRVFKKYLSPLFRARRYIAHQRFCRFERLEDRALRPLILLKL